MNYDSIILEMLSRIQALEDEVALLKKSNPIITLSDEDSGKVTTKDICTFIDRLKETALEEGQESLTLTANDIHKELGLKSRMPQVCNAMKQCMLNEDEVVFETPSGYSSTLQIKYYLAEWESVLEEKEKIMLVWEQIKCEFSANPRNVQTRPTDKRKPRWFYVSANEKGVYIESGRGTENNSKITAPRPLKETELDAMLALYERRKNGESVSDIAIATTQNQVYWYGIFAELGL